jgi:hypothetical protein
VRTKIGIEEFAERVTGHTVDSADVFEDSNMTIFQMRFSGGEVLNIVSGRDNAGKDIHVPQFWKFDNTVSVPSQQVADQVMSGGWTTKSNIPDQQGFVPHYTGYEEEEQ